jgi:Resolvase, N terminal domain
MRKPDRPKSGVMFRCAIYTRKSSDDGLEQEFNSLDAQREACEAYVTSQRHAGWIALPEMYDDGGLSGGTIERPALQRLLSDTKAGKVQIIVVYKVDRLTRSLADFAKIVDVLDAHDASFVSVTQQFNTTTSMGRLTLNMLLHSPNSNARSRASAFATRLPRRRQSACGWGQCAARLRRQGTEAGRQRGRGVDCPNNLQAIRRAWLGHAIEGSKQSACKLREFFVPQLNLVTCKQKATCISPVN